MYAYLNVIFAVGHTHIDVDRSFAGVSGAIKKTQEQLCRRKFVETIGSSQTYPDGKWVRVSFRTPEAANLCSATDAHNRVH